MNSHAVAGYSAAAKSLTQGMASGGTRDIVEIRDMLMRMYDRIGNKNETHNKVYTPEI